jgi:4-hydroxybenzoate polyprenyltransferase
MANYYEFFKERIPFIPYVTLTAGLTMSGAALTGERLDLDYARGMVFIALLLFFIVLRFMDEVKDVRKDLIAHPERPIPRGLIRESNVKVLIWITVLSMLLMALCHSINHQAQAGLSLSLLTVYSVLMYNEFFIPQWLGARPWIYALSHQFVLYFACWHSISFSPSNIALLLPYGTMVTTVFFIYEIGRKLDPQSHPILQTYRQVYGDRYIKRVILLLSALTAWASFQLELFLWTLPMLILVNCAMAYTMNKRFKIAEGLSSLSLLYHIWLPFLKESLGQ